MTIKAKRSVYAFGVGLLFVFVTVLTLRLPWTMDEFAMYQVLSCMQPAQQINTYFNGCGEYLTQLGPFEFERSFAYVGVVSSYFFLPIHAMFPFFWTNYVVGVIFFIALIFLVQRAFKLPLRVIPVGLFFFPLLYTVLHDAGPVRISLLVLVGTPFIALKYSSAGKAKVLWTVLLTVLWLIATDDKPFFLYLTPGITLFALTVLYHRQRLALNFKSLVPFVFLFGVPAATSAIYLMALRVGEQPYLLYLKAITPHISFESRFNGFISGILLTFDWPLYAHRTLGFLGEGASYWTSLPSTIHKSVQAPFDSANIGITVALLLALAVIILVATMYGAVLHEFIKSRAQKPQFVFVALLIATALVLAGGALATGGWANHHFVFFQVPLMVLLMSFAAQTTRRSLVVGTTAFVASLLSIASIWSSPVRSNADPELSQAIEVARQEVRNGEFINCGEYGCYYPFALLSGDEVGITYAPNENYWRELEEKVEQDNSSFLHVCLGCDQGSVQTSFPNLVIEPILTDSDFWRVFRVSDAID